MIRLLADHNIIQQAELVWKVFSADEWTAMNVTALLHFPNVDLAAAASDRDVWKKCQDESLLLITANRNADGVDSLASVIEELNHSHAMPVLTVSNTDRMKDFAYREDCAYRIADIAARIEDFLGTARLFIP